MSTKVNLDALIPREDFDVRDEGAQAPLTQTIQLMELEEGRFLYPVLRKPDFQRETADWTPERIVDLVASFLRGDLIPAVILWKSGQYIFVIDGSHRLSALIAWVHDDYGDGSRSRLFFDQRIPDEQIEVAEKTRKLIKRDIGSYTEHKLAVSQPGGAKPDVLERARELASLALQVQWVTGNAKQAENSFFKINQQAAPIDRTELRLIKARLKPNALAARAIMRAGTGHKYWSAFSPEQQQQIESLANEIFDVLFTPKLDTPIKTLDLPVAGRGYASESLPLVLEFVELANNVRETQQSDDPDGSASKDGNDADGSKTTLFLRETRKLAWRISSTHPSSLGLHPVVYFYSATGRYQPTSFLGVVSMMKEFERTNYYSTFTRLRKRFEQFLLRHKFLANQVTVKFGSGTKGFPRLKDLYMAILSRMETEVSDDKVVTALSQDNRFKFLKFEDEEENTLRKDFSTETKSATFLRDALASAVPCAICGGLMHMNSISIDHTIDHTIRKQDGGTGNVQNAQIAHPYCNSTYKG